MFKVIITDTLYNRIVAEEELKEEKARSYLYKLMERQPVEIISVEKTAQLRSHPKKLLDNPSSLYVLDIPILEANGMQKSYGVMCLSRDNLSISQLIDVNDIYTPEPNTKKDKGWDTVLDNVETLPSNALILTDRYLFATRGNDLGDGLANIKAILNEMLPRQFEGEAYHVAVIFCKDQKHESYKSLSTIAEKLEDIKRQMGRPYTITMELLGIAEGSDIYNDLHDRRIISNYCYVEATHKLAAYNKNNEGTVSQALIPMALFTIGSLNGNFASPLDSINQTLSAIRDFNKSVKDKTDLFYAVDGKNKKCKGITNRLVR